MRSQVRTLSNGSRPEKFQFRHEKGRHWFGSRVVYEEWNKLHKEIVSAKIISDLKKYVGQIHILKGMCLNLELQRTGPISLL